MTAEPTAYELMCRELLAERFRFTTPEWHPGLLDKIHAGQRVLLIERSARDDQEGAA